MTTDQIPLDDPEILRHILERTDVLLIDFDGPICSVFSAVPARLVARQLRGVLADCGHQALPPEIKESDDPFDIFSYAATLGKSEARHIELALREREVEAVTTAVPTPKARELLHVWNARGGHLAIVSNNSQSSVEKYVYQHDLSKYVDHVSARESSDPRLLKPDPNLLISAIDSLSSKSEECIFIGDSPSDIEAAHAAKVKAIGYLNKPTKMSRLTQANPLAIITHYGELIEFLTEATQQDQR
ncbi:MAG: HAD family hydrolase [Umezawaea sp.]